MRDLILLAAFPLLVMMAIRSPFVGLSLWFWSSMYPLENWVWGIATSLRFNLVFALLTIIGFFALKQKPKVYMNALLICVIVFYCHTFLATALNNHPQPDYPWNRFIVYTKILLFFVFCILMVRRKVHFDSLVTFLALSMCFYGMIEGIKYVLSGGGHKILGIIGPLPDNNFVALGLNMCVPMVLYLIGQYKHNFYLKWALIGIVIMTIVGILGTNSRGGLIGLVATSACYWWFGGRKVSYVLLALVLVGVGFAFLPDSWFARMDTISEADQDTSFLGRVISWKIATLVAMDHPFFGVGFDGPATKALYDQYAQSFYKLSFIPTPEPGKVLVAHSAYFQITGNQGFVGLLLFLMLIFTAIRQNTKLMRSTVLADWQKSFATSLKTSLISFSVSSAALNAGYFEGVYFLFAMTICLTCCERDLLLKTQSQQTGQKRRRFN